MCTNTEGSYVCRCKRGYAGDGKNCTGKIYLRWNPPLPFTLYEAFNFYIVLLRFQYPLKFHSLRKSCGLSYEPSSTYDFIAKVLKKKTCVMKDSISTKATWKNHLYCTKLHLSYHRLFLQILMNVLALKPTNVIQTPCVPTLKGHMFVAVKGDILVVAKTA